MSASFFGQDEHAHGRKSPSKLIYFLLAVFLLIWISGAFIYLAEKGESHATPTAAGHGVKQGGDHSALVSGSEALYRSLQLFHFHDNHWGNQPNLLGLAIRFAASAYTLGVPLVALVWLTRGGMRRWLHRIFGRNFLVVAGDGNEAKLLVESLVSNGHDVLFVTTTDKSHDHHSSGAIEITGDPSSPTFWQEEIRVDRAAGVVLLDGSDAVNVQWSVALEESLGSGPRQEMLPCHLHLGDLHLKKGLISLLPPPGDVRTMERRYFSCHEIAARLLSRNYPLPSTLVEETALPEHYVIIGFGQLGQNVALKLVKMGQQVVRKMTPDGATYQVCHPRMTVIDRRGEKAWGAFLRSHPGFVKTCVLDKLEMECHDPGFLNLDFLKNLPPGERCSLIFCLEDEALQVSTILMMLDVCQNPAKDINGIYLRSRRRDGPAELLRRRQPELSGDIPITTFAADREIWTEDVVLNLSMDLMAERIHEAYREGVKKVKPEKGNPAPAANKSWLALSQDERDGNREPADHLWAKLRTLGYQLETVPLSNNAPSGERDVDKSDVDLAAAIGQRIEELATSEHYRWMAWRLINGWKKGSPRDDLHRIHPDLVSYEELTDEARQKDRVVVRVIPELLRHGRLKATRL